MRCKTRGQERSRRRIERPSIFALCGLFGGKGTIDVSKETWKALYYLMGSELKILV